MASEAAANTDPRIVHAQALKSPYTPLSIYNTLIRLYSTTPYSLRLFSHLPFSPTVVSWTALISANSSSPLSLRLFLSMLRNSHLPHPGTLASLFKTAASVSALLFGLSLHSLSIKLSLHSHPFTASSLVNFYAKCRLPHDACKVFDEITDKDEVCYASAIVGLAQNSRPVEALSLFAEMKRYNVVSTVHSIAGALRAAAEMAALEQCSIIHGHALVTGFDTDVVVGSSLIDGYGKSGLIMDARQVFDESLPSLNVVGWNAMMSGYAQQGDNESVLELCNSMEARGFVPDEFSFLAILTAFRNAGLVAETKKWLSRMKNDYGLEPRLEHYTCLVGAMAQVGQLEEAESVAMTMPHKPDAAVWRALLTACASHGAADMASKMSRKLLALDPLDESAYSMILNVLSAAGRWNEVAEVRTMMKNKWVKKEGARSWIEVKGEVHVFMAGDRKHELTSEIYRKLGELMEEIEKLGYTPVFDHGGEREKREAHWYHSEKLAVAFGVVSEAAPPGKALRIVKNLRICRDCHEAFKYFCRVIDREIIVRDVNRYHRFFNGRCTCGDNW
ncbi:putative pentatricopeptide repeat-containing protein [Tripterygium wilfordii]|uniref:Putative pentatricopeptide repeat-containing protein n=1 Tax=Tripterygium wilfordii TaxID=458696 RepID=A0A7J7E172_TRIWF|nr:pentatricopeptide repeat-containing protein At4g33170-like [Tripterygium wilfordii]KAF5752422.1 putative pentatricopeptide repeat-containing protein [Tripterygium wilfordii]